MEMASSSIMVLERSVVYCGSVAAHALLLFTIVHGLGKGWCLSTILVDIV